MAAVSRRFFPSATQAELEAWLGRVEEEIATGKVTSQWSSADSSAGKWIDVSLTPQRRRDMILNDLSILDSATYDPRDYAPVRRTTPKYL